MPTRFVYSKAATPQLAKGKQMLSALRQFGEKAAAEARNLGPVGDSEPHYVDMIDVDLGIEGDTALARVNANKFTSNWIEFGTEDTPAFAPLRRGAEAAGLKVVAGRAR